MTPVQYTGCDTRMKIELDETALATPRHEFVPKVVPPRSLGSNETAGCQRPTCPPVEPNPPLPRAVSSKSCEGVAERCPARGEWTHLDLGDFGGVDAFNDQLGNSISLFD